MQRKRVESASMSVVIPSVSNEQPQADIFKLKIDHFEELFDWLLLEDLVSLGRTCKRMQGYVGYFIKSNYSASEFESKRLDKTTHSITLTHNAKRSSAIVMNGFDAFMTKFYVKNQDRVPHMEINQFASLKEMVIDEVVFRKFDIQRVKNVLGQLETVKFNIPFHLPKSQEEFYEFFLKFCTNLRRLFIDNMECSPFIGLNNSWLLRKYPKLEHLELTTSDFPKPIHELRTFFEQNTNVKSLAIHIGIIKANIDIFMNTTAKWDVLSVHFDCEDESDTSTDLLNELYQRGRFKILNAYYCSPFTDEWSPIPIERVVSLKGLTKLYVTDIRDENDLTPLVHLKQLCIPDASSIGNMQTLATKLTNLEFFQIKKGNVDDIRPFICHSPKLTTIVVNRLKGSYDDILIIGQLNKERSKLENARKITIYVEERVYLTVKWGKSQTSWSLIEIKRGSAYHELDNSFDFNIDKMREF